VVDLDGTLCTSDTLLESLWLIAKSNLWVFIKLLPKVLNGKVAFKHEVANNVNTHQLIKSLPWNKPVVKYLKEQHGLGRRVILATASDYRIAKAVQTHFSFISEVLATSQNANENLKGSNKAKILRERYGAQGYDYIGNDFNDIPVWESSKDIILVNDFSRPLLKQQVEKIKPVSIFFPLKENRLKTITRGLRLKQWSKNLLVFAPMIASHAYLDPNKWLEGLITFFAFGLTASGAYLLNDLLDLENDRAHHKKSLRPIAQGTFPLTLALALAILLPCAGVLMALYQGSAPYLIIYLIATIAYSLWLKKIAIVDIATLAGLYCVRIVTGGVTTQEPVSFWMAAFGGFLFVSLACIKRQAELLNLDNEKIDHAKGRGYNINDIALTRTIGVATGCIAPLVLALYLEGNSGGKFYAHPEYLWGSCGLIFIWIMSLWRDTEQKKLKDEDPISYSLTNKKSIILLILLACTLVLATYTP
jgi:4-hydroxybenzoate polyprenyltransferase